MILQYVLLLAVGLALLVFGGNWFVDGAASLARIWRMRPLVIGVVIIGFGTSVPEMLISVLAVLQGTGEIAVGNIIGSNIVNIGLVLAVGALIFPLAVDNQVVRRELPLTIAGTLLYGLLTTIDGELGLVDGIVLFVAFAAAMAYILFLPRRALDAAAEVLVEESEVVLPPAKNPLVAAGLTLAGLLLVLLGAQLTVDNASALARAVGLSEAVIGLTIVAIGTSLPELVSAVISALRRETDLVVGNVLGSNLYNLTVTGGAIGVLSPGGLALGDVLRFSSAGVMLVLTILLVPLLARGFRMSRVEGGLVLAGYLVYTYLLF